MIFTHWEKEKIGHWLNNNLPKNIIKFSNDSRKTQLGDCFIAIKTEKQNGHNFVFAAEQNGATCAIVEIEQKNVKIPQFIVNNMQNALEKIAISARKKFTGKVIAITGSFGKTTTKDLAKLLLGICKENATIGNENGKLGVCFTVARLSNTANFAIIEIGIDKKGTINSLLQICDPDIAIITGIGLAHCKNFETIESTANEKFQLANCVIRKNGACFVAKNCLNFQIFKKNIDKLKIVSDHFVAEGNERFIKIEHHKFQIPFLMSDGVAQNLCLAIKCVIFLGISNEQITKNLQKWEPSHMRGEIVKKDKKTFFVDCYNANDISFFDSIENFKRIFKNEKKLFIIGTLKESEIGKNNQNFNKKIGEFLKLQANDIAILIGEENEIIQLAFIGQNTKTSQIFCLSDKEQARETIANFKGAIFLKGHRAYALETLIC